jgi:hypothetical protein
MTRRAARNVVAALGVAGTVAAAAAASVLQQPMAPADWRPFVASWSAAGERHTVPTESGQSAAIIRLSGAVVLTTATEGLSKGFYGEAIAFDDARGISAGRAVWTDTQGDRVFSTLKGEPLARQRRILGTITGGTGPYAGIVGDYELTWQYVVETEGGFVQGRAVDLKGRFRRSGVSP